MVQFLQEYNLSRRRHIELLLNIVHVEYLRKFVLDLRGNIADVRVSIASTFSTTIGSRHLQQLKPKVLGVVSKVNNLSVGVKSKYVGADD